jgi:long-chain fatty acid transport protein
LFAATLVAGASIATIPAQGAGFYLSEIGSPGSVGTAGVANPVNDFGADSVWANPAGMVRLPGRELMLGAQGVFPRVEFDPDIAEAGGDDGGSAADPAFIPSLFAVNPLSERWAIGFGLAALQGGGIDYGDDFVGRYGTTYVQLTGLGLSGALAFKVSERFAIGAGVTAVYTTFEQEIAVNQGDLPDGKVKLDDLDDLGAQPYVGLQLKLTDRLLFGVTYRHDFDAELDGRVKLRRIGPGLDARRDLEVDWTNPKWVDAGLRYETPGGGWSFLVSGGWQEWSDFSSNRLAIDTQRIDDVVVTLDRNFSDTWYAGAAVIKRYGENRVLALGALYDQSPVQDKDRTVDLPFDEQLKLSGTYAWGVGERRSYALSATLILFGDAEIDQTAQGFRFAGEYDKNYILFLSASMRMRPWVQ